MASLPLTSIGHGNLIGYNIKELRNSSSRINITILLTEYNKFHDFIDSLYLSIEMKKTDSLTWQRHFTS